MSQYEEIRQKNWRLWWNEYGKYAPRAITKPTPIRKPKRSAKLSEFVGIMMGDGTIAPYHIAISLNRETDAAYIVFVQELVRRLFGVPSRAYEDKNSLATDIVVQRKLLTDFCSSLGLPTGNKVRANIDIPLWIQENKKYLAACVRGLIDTDGCVVIHRYRVKGRWYTYKKLSFTSASRPLACSVHKSLLQLGIKARLQKQKNVWVDDSAEVKKYFAYIGTSNEKHLKRYRN